MRKPIIADYEPNHYRFARQRKDHWSIPLETTPRLDSWARRGTELGVICFVVLGGCAALRLAVFFYDMIIERDILGLAR